jgi:beta-glucosidase
MLDLSVPAANPSIRAILRAPYLAQFVGRALSDVILGAFNPSGRLTLTFYAPPYSNNLPAMSNYSMAGRTYRYYAGEPLYEFGFGLSFTEWSYSAAALPASVGPCDVIHVTAVLKNIGGMSGAEVAQLYLTVYNASVPLMPFKQLVNFDKVALEPGDSVLLNLTITPEDNAVLRDGDFVPVIEPGVRAVWLGSSSGESRPGVAATFTVVGPVALLSSCSNPSASTQSARSGTATPRPGMPAHVWVRPSLNAEGSGGAARWRP